MLVPLSKLEARILREGLELYLSSSSCQGNVEEAYGLFEKLDAAGAVDEDSMETENEELYPVEYDEENDREIRRPLDYFFPGD